MPLPENEDVVKTAGALVETIKGAFHTPPGYRPAHAHGVLVRGEFTPTNEAARLSSAPHFNNPSTPVIARFSSSTGIPDIPDTSPDSNPRGFAVRFVLSEDGHKHTDIVSHTVPGFPVRTGKEFLAMLKAIGGGKMDEFVKDHPRAKWYVDYPKPFPVSFATQQYHGVNAFALVDGHGSHQSIRYRFEPLAGLAHHTPAHVEDKPPTYLFDELKQRLPKENVVFKLMAVLAEPGDITDDATARWPDDRKTVQLGTLRLLEEFSPEQDTKEAKHMIYDPVPRVEGIEPSGDPLIDMRAAIYLISGKERRKA